MSPSTNQQGDDTKTYQTEADRMLDTKPDELLLCIKPMTEELCREWVGACNRQGVSDRVMEHFVGCVKEHQSS